jgi:hypothetical protein
MGGTHKLNEKKIIDSAPEGRFLCVKFGKSQISSPWVDEDDEGVGEKLFFSFLPSAT